MSWERNDSGREMKPQVPWAFPAVAPALVFQWPNPAAPSRDMPPLREPQASPAALHNFLETFWDETEHVSLPKAVLVVEKALGDLWIQLPCIDQLGSCTYDDVCTILDNLIPPGTTCPEPLLTYGIPCHCPFKAGSYSLPASDFVLPDVELPAWMTNGNYRVRAAVSSGGGELGCVKLTFSLQSQ